MQLLISNLPVSTTAEDVHRLLTEQLGAPAPLDIRLETGAGERNALACVRYPEDAPTALGKVLDEKISGLHYQGHDLDATISHNFKE
ncbi:hypothetical protein [Chitinibacter sp. ZOR0017]|uniref:hypothetical protein n=1 Tax=Chitinibacter sp. ZOR0017 TaxID=1339254 RepID=UPI000646B27C|nr:hypothetical protein [Chitinibacter sp. ZOR0017]